MGKNVYNSFAALDGELAVPCTRNPLQRGTIPVPRRLTVRFGLNTEC